MRTLRMYVEKLGLDSKMSITDRDKELLERVLTDNGEFETAGMISQLDSAVELEDLIVNQMYE